jgi:hypothetical protein
MIRLLTTSVLLLSFACHAPGNAVPAKSNEPFKPSLSLRPVAVTLARGAAQAFQAELNYPEGMRYMRQPVAWSVVEPGGGSITPAGVYTAPGTSGTFHIQVRREDFPETTAQATVTVP